MYIKRNLTAKIDDTIREKKRDSIHANILERNFLFKEATDRERKNCELKSFDVG